MNLNQKLIKSSRILQYKMKKMDQNYVQVPFKFFNAAYFDWHYKDKMQMFMLKGKFRQPVYSAFSFILLYAYENKVKIQYSFQKKSILLEENDILLLPVSTNFIAESFLSSCQLLILLIHPKIFLRQYFYYFASDLYSYRYYLDPAFSKKIPLYFSVHQDAVFQLNMDMLMLLYTEEGDNFKDWDRAFCLLLQRLKKEYIQNALDKNADKDQKMLHYIDLYSQKADLQQCADYFTYHPVYFTNYLKKKYQLSFELVLHYFRLKKAKLLMEFSDLSLEEISKFAGYNSYVHFHRYYKKVFHKAPSKKGKR